MAELTPDIYNIRIEQGEDWSRTLVFYDGTIEDGVRKNLSGYNFYAQCRKDWDKDLVFDFEVSNTGLNSGVVVLSVTGSKTRDLCRIGKYKWDLFAYDPNAKDIKFLKGDCDIAGSQSRRS